MNKPAFAMQDMPGVVCSELNYSGSRTEIAPCGRQFSDRDVANAAVESYRNRRSELPGLPMGASNRDIKRAARRRMQIAKQLVMSDVAPQFGLDSKEAWGFLAAIVLILVGGPMELVVVVVAAVVEWAIEAELENRIKD